MGAENPIALMLSKLAVNDEPSTSHNPYGPIGRPRVASTSSQTECYSRNSTSSGRSSALLPTPPPSPPNAFLSQQQPINIHHTQQMMSRQYSPFGNGSPSSQVPFSGAGFRMYSPNSAFNSPTPTPFGTPPYGQNIHQHIQQSQQQQSFRQSLPKPEAPIRQQTSEDIEIEVFRELQALRSSVPDDYVCHRCNQKGHWIKFCPTKNPMNERTPYQGDRPSVGYFRCECTRQWKADAQKNTAMTCRGCRRPVFPYKMMKKSG